MENVNMIEDTPVATIVIPEEKLHFLLLTAGQVSYKNAMKGISWEQTRKQIIDALVVSTHPLTNEQEKAWLK